MNCSQMRMLLPPFANDELSDEEREMVELHLVGCAACRRALEEMRAMHGRLALLHTITVDTEIADTIILRIKRMTDTQAAETATDNMDMPSSHITDERETGKDDLNEDIAIELPLDSDGNLLPGWGLQGDP